MKCNPESIRAWQRRSRERAHEKAKERQRAKFALKAYSAPKPRKAGKNAATVSVAQGMATGIKRVGKKTVEWNRLRKVLNADYQRRGITICEIQLPGCWRNNGLTHAHRMKRRFIVTEAEMLTTALACLQCHQTIEAMSHREMFDIVDAAIQRRTA